MVGVRREEDGCGQNPEKVQGLEMDGKRGRGSSQRRSSWRSMWEQNRYRVLDFPDGSESKESACDAGDLGWEEPLGKGMATHSSMPVWRIPWTEEPGGLQSIGSKRVRYN